MPFPKTIDEAIKSGYVFIEDGPCKGKAEGGTCTANIEWWKTPKGKRMPFDVDAKGNLAPHWATCPDHETFRK